MMGLFLFLTFIIAIMVYVHLILPKKLVKPEWMSLGRVRFDLFFLQGTVFFSLLLLKPDAFGPLQNWQFMLNEGVANFVIYLLYAYLIVALYALPGFIVILLFYRLDRWSEKRMMREVR